MAELKNAYDLLYNLQKMYLYYEMQGGSTIGQNYSIEQNKSYYDVFRKIEELINKNKADSGIYGTNVEFVIDERLKNHYMPYVLLGYDTAWNMLKELANQALCFVYVNRLGQICVIRDELGTDRLPDSSRTICETQINEDNAFSYNLPTMSRTVVNRVKVTYLIEETCDSSNNRFKIKENDVIIDENNCKKIILELKNFYKTINSIKRYSDSDMAYEMTNPQFKSIKCCYDKIEITFNNTVLENDFYLRIDTNDNIQLIEKTITINDYISQKRNGIAEFEPDAKNIYSLEKATELAQSIMSEYADGKPYIETDWVGNPEATLGSFIQSKSKKEEELTRYEIVSNELTLENGLRFSSKARQN